MVFLFILEILSIFIYFLVIQAEPVKYACLDGKQGSGKPINNEV